MSDNRFNSFLPDDTPEEKKNLEGQLPYLYLMEYAQAVNEKYGKKLEAKVTERDVMNIPHGRPYDLEDIKEDKIISLTFRTPIGSGYLYQLMELKHSAQNPFPVKVKVFSKSPSTLGFFKNYEDFDTAVSSFLKSGVVQTIILNLLSQVDLYNDYSSRDYGKDYK